MKKEYIFRRLASIVIVLSLCTSLLSGCDFFKPVENLHPEDMVEAFDKMLDELFAEAVTADSLSMNYYLANPESLGIERPTPTFGEVASAESILRDIQETQDLYDRLDGFRYEALRTDQQIIYDILMRNLELSQAFEREEDFAYYIGYIRPMNGIQVQLPILLAEFNFYSAVDIELYLQLLNDTWRFFDEIILFERERSRRGFFLSDANVDKVIEHCESFLAERENNLLIIVFSDKIDRYDGLSFEQREQFKHRNRELVLGNVLPAYEALLGAMRELRGYGANQGGLADLPDGKTYASLYLNNRTGTDRTPAQVDRLISDWMDKTFTVMVSVLRQNPHIVQKLEDSTLGAIPNDSPENYLSKLQQAIVRDFPPIKPTGYVVREVHESLQEHVSPAFYLTPAIDRYDDNVIYINPGSITDNMALFTTLAHEGYPGHMYQMVYYLQQSPHPIRKMLENLGYDDGWATYVEMISYMYADIDEAEALFLQSARLFDLLLHSRIDLGVNALGWGIDRVGSLLMDYGIGDPDVLNELYEMVIGNPLLFMQYGLGYIEIRLLLEEAEKVLGNDFDLLEFHRFILDFGSAPFPLIRSHMKTWMAAQRTSANSSAA